MIREGAQRAQVRAYLLGTLRPGDRKRLEMQLRESPELRAVYDEERRALAQLDDLPDPEPPHDLTGAVMEKVAAAEAAGERKHHGMSIWQYAVTIACVLLAAVLLVHVLGRIQGTSRLHMAENNLKQIGLALKMYAAEDRGGNFPPSAPYEGVWSFDLRVLYPDFINDPSILINPRRDDAKELEGRLREALAKPDWETAARIVAQNYAYTGWVVRDEEDTRMLRREYARLDPEDYDNDIRTDQHALMRPREGIERFFITDINNPAAGVQAQSAIILLFEPHEAVDPSPTHLALFMDGSVGAISPEDPLLTLPLPYEDGDEEER